MPLPLSTTAITEKNKLAGDSVFLVLLEIVIPGIDQTVRVVHNTEDIIWNSYTWQKMQFQLDDIRGTGAGEVPQVEIRVDNSQQALEYYLHQYENWCKINYRETISCTIYVINSHTLEQMITVNGKFAAGATDPADWTGSALEEPIADAWVTGGIDGSKCLRVVRSIGNGATAMSLVPSEYVYFDPPYPMGFRTSYWSKGESILADGGGTQASRMTAAITYEDDSTASRPDSDTVVPVGETDWYLREYSYLSTTLGIKRIRPYFYTRYQSGTLYLDSVETHMIWDSDPEAEFQFELIQPKVNPLWVTFTLGAKNPFNRRYPLRRLLPVCPYRDRGPDCLYAGVDPEICDKSWDRCKLRGNTERFGGFYAEGRPLS